MSTVLGFATTQTAVELVRIDGFGADGAHATHGSFRTETDGLNGGGTTASAAYRQLAARVWFQMKPIARAADNQVRSVGVTWSQGADHEASLLVGALTAAGFDNVVAVEAQEARRELSQARGSDADSRRTTGPEPARIDDHARGSVDELVQWLHTVADGDAPVSLDEPPPSTDVAASAPRVALALGAALAAAHAARQPDETVQPQSSPRRPGTGLGTKARLLAGGLALLVVLSIGSELRHTSEQPSGPTRPPQLDTTSGGLAVVPAPVHRVQAPLPEAPPDPAPAFAPDVDGSSPPAEAVPELPESVPTPAQSGPAPQEPAPLAPAPLAPADQLPPPVPNPPPSEQTPPGPTCLLLCHVAI